MAKTNHKKGKLTGPTYLTILRMLLAVIFMFLILIPEFWTKILAIIIFVIAALTDKVDGAWARHSHLESDLGAFLDPLADKMLVDLALLVLVYLNMVPLWVFALIIVRDLAVDGMRMFAAREGVTIAASKSGKLKTTCQLTALIVIMLYLVSNVEFLSIVGNIILYIALLLTIISGAAYIANGYKRFLK